MGTVSKTVCNFNGKLCAILQRVTVNRKSGWDKDALPLTQLKFSSDRHLTLPMQQSHDTDVNQRETKIFIQRGSNFQVGLPVHRESWEIREACHRRYSSTTASRTENSPHHIVIHSVNMQRRCSIEPQQCLIKCRTVVSDKPFIWISAKFHPV